MKKFIFCVLTSSVVLIAQSVPSKKIVTFENIEVSSGGVTQAKRLHIIDLGVLPLQDVSTPEDSSIRMVLDTVPEDASCKPIAPIPESRITTLPITVSLKVKGLPKAQLQVMAIGHKVEISVTANPDLSNGLITLLEGQSKDFTFSFNPSKGDIYELSGTILLQDGRPITTGIIKYIFMSPMQSIQIKSGMVPSGQGDELSTTLLSDGYGYRLLLGESPVPYTLSRACYWLRGDRTCGSWATCSWINTDDREVSMTFRLQGHKESSSAKDSEGYLQADYALKSSRITLK